MQQPFSLTEPVTPRQAFLTDDNMAILRFAAQAMSAGMAAALVTLTDVRGGAARLPGAQMAVREDGQYCGFVSGGCVEAAAAFEALEVMQSGRDRTVIYGEGSPYFDIVLPCGGSITLTIHALRSAQPLLAVLNTTEQREPACLRYHPSTQHLQSVAPGKDSGREEHFDVHYRPAVRVMVYGRSVEAQVTASLAQAAGYDVHTFDGVEARNSFALIDADTAVVLLYHDLHRELPILQAALAATPFYVGALGSSRTHQQRVQRLTELGWSARDTARIKAPIGLFPKARDAHSLALSILADVAAVRTKAC
ncbi:XdhC family protein [Enterobacter sp.]|uniref:XdhC family protein n=1 Tax=Enterobacter sp. TaxID=42895 RepID=UPI00296E80FF|nr:XdhC family protein [Enterobacter sp.]